MVPPGRLVDATALHPDESVLDDVDSPHPVSAPDEVEPGEQPDRVEGIPSTATGVPCSKPMVDHLGPVQSPLRIGGHLEHPGRWSLPRVLEDSPS